MSLLTASKSGNKLPANFDKKGGIMPLFNGVCLPPVCFTRKLLAANAKVILTVSVNGTAQPARDVTNLMNNLLQQGLNDLTAAEDLKCDGCVCYTIVTLKPPLKVPAVGTVQEDKETAANGDVIVRKYEIQADYLLMSVGMCYPPGTQIKVNEKWVPVEKAPPSKTVYEGGGKSGGKKKHPKRGKGKAKRTKKRG
jgi:hypothetical protein